MTLLFVPTPFPLKEDGHKYAKQLNKWWGKTTNGHHFTRFFQASAFIRKCESILYQLEKDENQMIRIKSTFVHLENGENPQTLLSDEVAQNM